jgi:putative phage-type endonuclease
MFSFKLKKFYASLKRNELLMLHNSGMGDKEDINQNILLNLKKLRNRVKTLQKKPQPAQRSPEWYLLRHHRITASEVASCLFKSQDVCKNYIDEFNLCDFKIDPTKSISHYDTREEYIIKKCRAFYGENVFIDSIYTLWGKKYEEIATRLYRKMYMTDVLEFGLLPHPRLSWIGASPDGITPDGVMLEIKCPFSRKIDGIVPFHYWTQMQLQLEVCDLERCDFLECELKELDNEESFINQQNVQVNSNWHDFKGILINILDEPKNSETKYIYPPDSLNTVEEYISWSNKAIENLKNEGKEACCIYYYILKWNIINVKRSKEWFNNVKNTLKETYNLIKKLQDDLELFEKYKESIHLIKNKEFIQKYNSTVCLIGSEYDHDHGEENDEENYYMEISDSKFDICLLSDG